MAENYCYTYHLHMDVKKKSKLLDVIENPDFFGYAMLVDGVEIDLHLT